jgi:phosphoribosylformylglycinamidine synthase subunit PurS
MMKYTVYVNILPHTELLDPQGKATLGGLHSLGFDAIADVRVGKRIELHLDAHDREAAKKLAEEAAKKLLINPIMEGFSVEVVG